MLILLAIVFVGCSNDSQPISYEEVIGEWTTNEKFVINFASNHTFNATNLQSSFFNNNIEEEVVYPSENGIWYFDVSKGKPTIYLDFENSENLKGGFSTHLIINEGDLFYNKNLTLILEFTPPNDYYKFEFSKN